MRVPVTKALFDTIVSLIMVVAAVVLVWTRVVPTSRANGRLATLEVPTIPLAIDGLATEGAASATMALVEFTDVQCPYCGAFERDVMPSIRKEFIDTGKVLLAVGHNPLPIHANARRAAEVAACAQTRSGFRQLWASMFAKDAMLDDEGIRSLVIGAGAGWDAVAKCRVAGLGKLRVDANIQQARSLGVRATPSFFVGSRLPDGRVRVQQAFSGAKSVDDFRSRLSVSTPR